jgi:hypothetical protein
MPISRLLALSLPLAVLALPSAALAKASSTPDVKTVGWTTAQRVSGVSPQVKDKGRITQCLTGAGGSGQSEVNYIFKARLPRTAKIGIALWVVGGSRSLGAPGTEPTNAEVAKTASRWGFKTPTKYVQQAFGNSFAQGPFGSVNVSGQWFAKVVVNGKLMRRSSVTIACA